MNEMKERLFVVTVTGNWEQVTLMTKFIHICDPQL